MACGIESVRPSTTGGRPERTPSLAFTPARAFGIREQASLHPHPLRGSIPRASFSSAAFAPVGAPGIRG
jgi:hypothetical protein